ALSAIPAETDAVYLSPLPQLDAAGFSGVAEGLIARQLPSFTLAGPADVERGLLATQTVGADPERLARTVGLYIFRILHGEQAGNLPVAFHQNTRLTLNMATARAIGYYP